MSSRKGWREDLTLPVKTKTPKLFWKACMFTTKRPIWQEIIIQVSIVLTVFPTWNSSTACHVYSSYFSELKRFQYSYHRQCVRVFLVLITCMLEARVLINEVAGAVLAGRVYKLFRFGSSGGHEEKIHSGRGNGSITTNKTKASQKCTGYLQERRKAE